MSRLRHQAFAAIVCCAVCCTVDFAQGEPAPQAEPNALQGPEVKQSDRPESIVERDAAGRLKPLATSPEEAAIELLAIDDATREKIGSLLGGRRALVDKAVRDNIGLLIEIQGAKTTGNNDGQVEMFKTLLERAPALKDLYKFRESLMDALPPEKAGHGRRMVAEYWEAFASDLQDSPQAAGLSQNQIFQIEMLKAMGDEIRQSYERIAQFNNARLDETLKAVDATPEQEAKIRAITAQLDERTKLIRSKPARIRLFREVSTILTPEQMVKLMQFRYAGAAPPAEPPHPAPDPNDEAQMPPKAP